MHNKCTRCEKTYKECECEDLPQKEGWNIYFYFNRNVELMARLARIFGFLSVVIFLISQVKAEEHFHPVQDEPLHDKFYSKWLRPNPGQKRVVSCCNKIDCYPTAIKYERGWFWARRREDGNWIQIPVGVLEEYTEDPRESPDYQSHACISPPQNGNYVFCAVRGSGG